MVCNSILDSALRKMGATKALLFLFLMANEQVWSDTIPNFYNFSEANGWFNNGGGNWRFTYYNDHPDPQHAINNSDAGYTFSQDGARTGINDGLASPLINGVDNTTIFSFNYYFSAQTAYPGSGIEFYGCTDEFRSTLAIGRFSSDNTWENGTIDCSIIKCCDIYPCNLQILVLDSDGDYQHPTVAALAWFSTEVIQTKTTISTTSTRMTTTITTAPLSTVTETDESTTETPYTETSTTQTTTAITSTSVPTTTEMSTTKMSTAKTSTTTSPTTPSQTPSTQTSTSMISTSGTATSQTSIPFTTAVPSNSTVTYNFSSCTTEWFNYGAGDWKFTCMDEHPDILHPHIDSDVGYTFSQDGLNIPMVGLSSPIITGVNSRTIFTFSYWFSLSTAFPGSVGLEFYSSIDNFGTLKPLGTFLSNDEWTIGSITCSLFKCCATYPCDLQILVLNTKGDVDHRTVSALQWFTIGNRTSN